MNSSKAQRLSVLLISTILAGNLTACGTLTGIPSHGGGKRFATEQRLVSASIRSSLKDIDVTPLRGKRVAIVFDLISDEGGGSLNGGRLSLGTFISAASSVISPVSTTSNAFQIFNLKDSGTNYNNAIGGSTSAASTVMVSNGSGTNTSASSSTGTNTSTTNGSGTNTSTTNGSGTNTSTTNGSGNSTSNTSGNSNTSESNNSNGSNTTITGGITTNGSFNQTGGGTSNTNSNSNTTENHTNNSTTNGSNTNTATANGSNTSNSSTNGSNTGTSTTEGSNTNTSNGTNTQTGSGTNNSNSGGGYDSVRQTLPAVASESVTRTKTKGGIQGMTASLQYRGLGDYENFNVPKSDASLLMGLVRNYLLLNGAIPTVPTDPNAEALLYVTVDIFGIVRSRFDAYVYNNETLKAETSFEMMAFDRAGRMIMAPRSANREAKYQEHYLLWAGPITTREKVYKGQGLLVDFSDVDGSKATYNPSEKVNVNINHPLGKN